MFNSIIRRSSVNPEQIGNQEESPKAGTTKEFYDRAFGKLVAEREKTTAITEDNHNIFNLPTVLESCNCTYVLEREEYSISSSKIDGQMFCTEKAMYFVSLFGNHSFILDWSDTTECFTTVPSSIVIHYRSPHGITQSHIFTKLQRRDKVFRLINQLILEAPATATRTSRNHNLNGQEPRRKTQTEIYQRVDKVSCEQSIQLHEQQKQVSTPSHTHELAVTIAPKFTSQSRTKSESEFVDHTKLSQPDRGCENGSIGVNLSVGESETPPTFNHLTLQRNRSNTMPDMTVHPTRLEPSFDLDTLSKIKLRQNFNRQESTTTNASQRRRAVKYKGKKKTKREEAHQPENQRERDSLEMNAHRVSVIHRNIFLRHFGNNGVQSNTPIVLTYSCAYHPSTDDKNTLLPLLHGRMFCTFESLFFAGWKNKKIILKYDDIMSLQKESTAWNTIPNAIRIFYHANGVSSSYFFGSFINRDASISALQHLLNFYRSEKRNFKGGSRNVLSRRRSISYLPEHSVHSPSSGKNILVPHDERIALMTSMASKRLKNVSVHDFFNICWRDETDSFYGLFLIEKRQNFDVLVGAWEDNKNIGSDDAQFYHAWSEDYYTMKRRVSYKTTRKTHLYIGPPIAEVNETQFCRIENDNKLVVAITVDINGLPFSNNFTIEIRWVARADGSHLIVDIGQLVIFKKRVLIASKIQSSTTEEMKPVTLSHLEFCREACEKKRENNDDISDFSSVESCMELDIEEPKISRSRLNLRSGLRFILSPFFSVFLISQNILGQVHYSLIFLILFVLNCYLLLIGFKVDTQRFATSCNELADMRHQLKTLTEEIKEIRLSLIAK